MGKENNIHITFPQCQSLPWTYLGLYINNNLIVEGIMIEPTLIRKDPPNNVMALPIDSSNDQGQGL
jgi:hypothetical protein